MTTIYIPVVIIGWSKNGMILWIYKSINNKASTINIKNSEQNILRDITRLGLRIKKNPGINVVYHQIWRNSAFKKT